MQDIYKNRLLPSAETSFKMKQGDGKYFPSEKLIKAIELATLLNKPLLIAGEPGTGKTDAAHHIAEHFGLGDLLIYNTQTSSSAQDLLYRYNSLAHFQYSRSNTELLSAHKLIEKSFITYNPLGEAIKASADKKRRVVLIDEIDKAPRDLPNDMLDIIENMRFKIDELKINKKENEADISEIVGDDNYKPIVILTTNSEKSLPEPFLRRCIFFYINFEEVDLLTILKNKLSDIQYSDEQWNIIIRYFKLVREELRGKKPATAELIMWTWVLNKYEISPEMLNESSKISKPDYLKNSYSVLIKDNDDWQRIINLEDDYFVKKMKL